MSDAPPIYADLVAEQGDALAIAAEAGDRIDQLATQIIDTFAALTSTE